MQQAAPSVRELFVAAVELESPAARSEFLDRHCGDAELRRRIEELLAVDAQGSDFLEVPAAMVTVTTAPDSRPGVEEAGTSVGPYKLLEVIGEGGMGTVYMAEQAQPVRRRVALKVIKPGMDSKQVVARFEAERQALAMMDHPNIAKVFDGGMTPSGRPYFVMELVRGVPITEYCDRHQLSIPERLDLFVLVCRAVQHAHQKGIIHRDLKPSNVLVSDIDGVARPKVIDFGVAKATGQALTEKTLFTGFHQFVGTPLYTSPEQAELSGADVDTRSDIYSLGVLLYELLTGTTPFDSETLRRAAFDEMRRIIREEEPPRPSTRLSTLGDRLSTVSASRKADPKRLGLAIRGELDWVVMKALEKDRRRRYETANEFAADVMRYLTDRPVEAYPPSVKYRFAKFARRNRVALTMAGLLSTLTVAGIALGTALVWREKEQTRRALLQSQAHARTAAERLELTRRAVDEMYSQVAERWLAQQPRLTNLQREFLVKAAAFYQELVRDPGSDPEERHGAAEAALRLGRVREKLGQLAEAEAAYRNALALDRELIRRFPDEPQYRRGLGLTLRHLAGVLERQPRTFAESERAYRQAIDIQERLVAAHPADLDCQRDLAHSLGRLGTVLPRGSEEAVRLVRRAVELGEFVVRESGAKADDRLALADFLINLGHNLTGSNRLPEKAAASARSIELLRQIVAESPERPDYRHSLALACMNRGVVDHARGQLADQERTYREAISHFDRLAAEFPKVPDYRYMLALSHSNLSGVLWETGRRQDAGPAMQRAKALLEGLVVDFPEVHEYPVTLARKLTLFARHWLRSGRPDEAEACYRRAGKLYESLVADSNASASRVKWDYLIELVEELVTTPSAGPGIYTLAHDLARKAVDLRPDEPYGRQALGWASYRTGDWKGCLESLQEAGGHSRNGDFFAAMAYWRLGDEAKAHEWFARADAWLKGYGERHAERRARGENTHPDPSLLRRARDEAEALLGIRERTPDAKGEGPDGRAVAK